MNDTKGKIREFVNSMLVDDVGFAAVGDYRSPKSPEIASIFPGVKSIIVLAYKELSNCDSDNMQIAMSGRLDLMEFSRSCDYKLARYLEREFKAKCMSVPASYPMEMSLETSGTIGDVSLRHAAVAAGLGVFGRHNIVIHPRFGSRVLFTAVLTDLVLEADPPAPADLCTECNACVDNCPAGALNEEGKTDVNKCLKNSQPYGLGGQIRFWSKFGAGSPEEQKKLLRDPEFWRMYQAGFIGFQYFCFNCLKSCPVGRE
ncbi:MAG TPA: 4Fe-4S binding protein [Verrucomicrobiae bacterium]|nr:4Fe-4S binding protein [Verrucomicrobiae bacterium]